MSEAEQDALMDRLVAAPAGAFGPTGEAPGGGAAVGADSGSAASDGSGEGREPDPFASPDFTTRERAILAYTDQLTVAPASVAAEDLRPLREAGLDDRGIHDVCAIASYYAFVNRIADGLGVELETDGREWKDGPSA